MYEVPITSAADAFIWGFVIVLAFVVALVAVDVFKEVTKDNMSTKDKKL